MLRTNLTTSNNVNTLIKSCYHLLIVFCIFSLKSSYVSSTPRSVEEKAQHAINRGRIRDLASLLNGGFAINDPVNEAGSTMLHLAAADGSTLIINFLIQRGSNINCKDHRGVTPLHNAAWRGNTLAIQLLVSLHASVDEKTNDNQTPLHYACWKGHVHAAQLLLDAHANVNAVNSEGKSPLWYALQANAPILVQHILNNHHFLLNHLEIPQLVRLARRGDDSLLRMLDDYMSTEISPTIPENTRELSPSTSWILVNPEDYEMSS